MRANERTEEPLVSNTQCVDFIVILPTVQELTISAMDELLPKALPVEAGEADSSDPKWDIPAQSAASYLKMVSVTKSILLIVRCP